MLNSSPKQNKALLNIKHYAGNYKIFIDTSSILHPKFNEFLENISPFLKETNNKIIIPTFVLEELKKHGDSSAQNAIKTIYDLQQNELLEARKMNESSYYALFFTMLMNSELKYKLLLITQNAKLAQDVLNLNNTKESTVSKINTNGFLDNFYISTDTKKQRAETIDKFELPKTINHIPTDALNISKIPSEGDTVGTEYGNIRLIKCIGSGGEGSVYETNTPYIAKIYKKDKINKAKYEKVKLMLSKKIECSGVCWPVALVYNQDNQFVGYLMPRAHGREIQRFLFSRALLQKYFPKWKKRDTVELCLTILEKIQYLHERNIILGDINPGNILVSSLTEVYFVDTDSYQIEGFPCPVGTPLYTAPEIQRKRFASFLRSFENEYFAVATLLFMIMLPGKPPYAHQDGEDIITNIINMNFSYPLGEQSNKKTPPGQWRHIWSHMPFFIKEAFYQSFRKGEKHSTEGSRLTTKEWKSKFANYLELLDSGKLAEQDEMSEELFPTRFKKVAGIVYVKCKLCHKDVQKKYCQKGICPDCLKRGEIYRCSRCKKELLFTNYQKYIKNNTRHDYCPDCFEYLNKAHSYIRCVDCGTTFEFTNREYEYYAARDLCYPKRCKNCRDTKRTLERNPVRNRGLCFITTAACQYLNKPDDCYELTMFRKFRDLWLIHQPDGEYLINKYYEIAPALVKNLDASHIKDILYHELWNKYLQPCLTHIENKKYSDCKQLYKTMVYHLTNKIERWS